MIAISEPTGVTIQGVGNPGHTIQRIVRIIGVGPVGGQRTRSEIAV